VTVYFIQHGEGGDIKIGHTSRDPYGRMAALQTGTPLVLTLLATVPGGSKEEGELHEKFTALKVRGEWFRPEPPLLGFIEGARWAQRESPPKPPEGWEPGAEEKENGPTLYGLTRDQVHAVAGFVQRTISCAKANLFIDDHPDEDDSLERQPSGELDEQELLEATRLVAELEMLINGWFGAGAVGVRFPNENTPADYLSELQKVIARHHEAMGYRVAESRLAEGAVEGTDPSPFAANT
jgi:hypothetical protein